MPDPARRSVHKVEVMRLTEGRGVDVVLDAVGGKSFAKSYRVVRSLGRLFLFGGSAFAAGKGFNSFAITKAFFSMPKFKPFAMMEVNKGVFGVNLGHLWDRSDLAESLRRVPEEGGKVIEAIQKDDGAYVYAMVKDPVGAFVALVPGT